jgi:O-antigen ligase
MQTLVVAVDRLGFLILALSIVAAPIPFGSNSADAAGILGLLLSICLFGSIMVPVPRAEIRGLQAAVLWLAALIVAITIVQVLPFDAGAWAHPVWGLAKGAIDTSPPTIAVSRYQPLHSIGYVLLPLAAFVSCLVYAARDRRYMRLMHVILALNVAVTVLSLLQYALAPNMLLWVEKRHYLDSFTGTFVNRNSAATYFGVLLIVSLSLTLNQLTQGQAYRLLLVRQSLTRSERRQLARLVAYCIATVVLAIALLLTKSRAGVFSALVGVVIFTAAFGFLALRARLSALKALAMTIICVSGTVALFVAYGEGWIGRLRADGLFDETRACVYKSMLPAIRDHFWLGSGLGTFQDLFPSYRLPECGVTGHWEMGHSVYLEGLLALGASFVVCAFLFYYRLLGAYVYGLLERRRWRFVPLSCLGVMAAVTLHSMVDFSLQIPGVAVLVAAVLGSGAGMSLARSRATPQSV